MPGEPCSKSRRALLAAAALTTLPARAAVQDTSWNDRERGRELPLRIRWPQGAGPWPLLLYSHGLGGSRTGAEVWSGAWADAGFVVVHLQHRGSDVDVWTQDLSALRAAASAQQLLARVADVKFVLDEIGRRQAAGDAAWTQARLDAIGLAGHSFGAHTVCALAGKRFPVPAPGLIETRARAFVAFSPTITPGRMTPAEQFGPVTRPFMVLTGSLDGDPFGAYTGGKTRWRVFEGLPSGAKAGLWLDGADHMSFAGISAPLRVEGPLGTRDVRAVAAQARHQALIVALTTLWWQWRLRDDVAAASALARFDAVGAADRWVLG